MNWTGAAARGTAIAMLAVAFGLFSQQAAGASKAAHRMTTTASPIHVSGAHAIEYVRQILALGPRPVGSPAHKRLEEYLRGHLKNDNLEEDGFTAATPDGEFPMRNFIAKFPGKRDGIVVISGHYDTLKKPGFVGANDGGSSAGLLLTLADYYRTHKPAGYSVWLAWFDGEEAFRQWSDQDSTYGSRHLAEKWQTDGTLARIKAFILVDMIGDADLSIMKDGNSTPWLQQVVYDAAKKLGYQSHFFTR